jgi:dethiobiotin synthetase
MKAPQILFITGTDTGVGKTVFAALATVYLRRNGFRLGRSG